MCLKQVNAKKIMLYVQILTFSVLYSISLHNLNQWFVNNLVNGHNCSVIIYAGHFETSWKYTVHRHSSYQPM